MNVKKKLIAKILTVIWFWTMVFLPIIWNFAIAQDSNEGRFDSMLEEVIEPLTGHIDTNFIISWEWGAISAQKYIIQKIMDIIVPLFISLWIMFAMFGMYSVMFSSGEWDFSRWIKYIVYWVSGILLIMSAQYITNVIVVDIMQTWIGWIGYDLVWVDIASTLYEKIAYPFLKMLIYLVLWWLFVTLLINVFKYITSSWDEFQKDATTIIIWTTISTFIIIWAKQLVEAVFGKQADVINQNAQNLWDIWTGVLADKNIPILYTIINWILGFASLFILLVIIFQTFKFLTNPDNEDQLKSIRKSLLYIFIGIVIIGAWYLIVNFLIIN